MIGHLNKSSGTQSTYRGLGSIDIMAAVRSLIFIGKVRKDPTTRVLIHEKSSLAPPGETMAFKLGDEDELYKKWTMTFVTYRLEIIKLWHHKSILLFLLLTNIAKQCLTNIIPFLCMWAMNLPVNKDIFKAVFFSSSYLQLISSYIPAGGAEVAYQNLYTFVFSSSYLPSIAASNLLWRVFTFYFHLLFGGLCLLFYKGSPKRDELLSNTATIFDLQVINFSQSADDKTKEFSLGIIDKNHKHSKKELLSKEDVERSFLKIIITHKLTNNLVS